jgi:Helicase HerA, central domain
MSSATDFERLGSFYLGRLLRDDRTPGPEPVLVDAKDFTTHAVCLGMTGSGKTGLCVSLLEEAAIDGVPAIAIDPKGDLGNLLLTFPSLAPEDFRPWIDETAAAREGRSPDEQARVAAELWRKGLADWGQDGARIARMRETTDVALYTPGSSLGRPLSVLRSLQAPADRSEGEAMQERVAAAAASLLALLGIEADPLRSREHILLSNVIDHAWREGRDLELADLIRLVQSPPFERVGVFDVESFFPAKERLELAMTLNNLLASPGFAAWTEGEPLDVGRLLYTREGKPRLSILSIAHLDDRERMFFVTLLLGEVVAWMRTQPGTQSLRALLYMDEVMGFLPPSAAPPSKAPMLTLLKQARAFGVGVVLATQNPVDLDYKALSNTGIWFLGRLQTERDQARVLDGLEGSAAARGGGFDRGEMERLLAGLGKRVFLLHSVHEEKPVLFGTRWALSYLRGPLTREEVARLVPKQQPAPAAAPVPAAVPVAQPAALREADASRPALPAGLEERFLAGAPAAGTALVYRPALLGAATLRYADARTRVDHFERVTLLRELDGDASFEAAQELDAARLALGAEPLAGARFAPLPAGIGKGSAERLRKALAAYLQRERPLRLLRSAEAGLISRPGEEPGAFRVRVREALREQRDATLEKLRASYAPKLARAQQRVQRAAEEVERQRSQRTSQVVGTAISVGATVLGALFGRSRAVGTVGRAATAARGAARTAREQGDVSRALEGQTAAEAELQALDAAFQAETEQLRSAAGEPSLDELSLRPRKSDTQVEQLALVWLPYRVGPDGRAEPAFPALV